LNYYIAEGGQQRGPYALEDLASQGLRPDTLIWTEGMSQWQRADHVPALRGVLASLPGGGATQQAPGAFGSPASSDWSAPAAGYGSAQAHGGPAAYPGQSPYGTSGAYPGPVNYAAPPGPGGYPPYTPGDSKKIAAGICALLLGSFGIHKFILGMNSAGIVMLLVSLVGGVVTCGMTTGVMSIIAFVEGIIYLTKTDEQFYWEYIVQKKQWF